MQKSKTQCQYPLQDVWSFIKDPVHFGTGFGTKLSYKCLPFFTLPGHHPFICENCAVELLLHLEKYVSACWMNCDQLEWLPVADIRGNESKEVPGESNVA